MTEQDEIMSRLKDLKISELKQEILRLEIENRELKKNWNRCSQGDFKMLYSNSKRVASERMSAEIIQLKDRILGYQENVKGLQDSLRSALKTNKKQKDTYETMLAEKDAVIKELTNQLAHISAVAERNGANTGTPTAATPINQKKTIPNSSRGSEKQREDDPGMKDTLLPTLEIQKSQIRRSMNQTCSLTIAVCVTEHLQIQAIQNQKMNLMSR